MSVSIATTQCALLIGIMEELVLERDNEVLTYGTNEITEQIFIPERQEFIDY